MEATRSSGRRAAPSSKAIAAQAEKVEKEEKRLERERIKRKAESDLRTNGSKRKGGANANPSDATNSPCSKEKDARANK
jgi:hypothetical protein